MITTIIIGVVCLFAGFFVGLLTEAHARDKAVYSTRHEHDAILDMRELADYNAYFDEAVSMTQANSELIRRLSENPDPSIYNSSNIEETRNDE